jgi:FlaA1/EpsC-like NDP-sugar epimerase
LIDYLKLIGRERELFNADYGAHLLELSNLVRLSKILVIGGAGSIGRSVVYEMFKLNPSVLHVVDINENGLVELVRGLRSTLGYIEGEFKTFAIDCGGNEFMALMSEKNIRYDYVFNFSAMKHVRGERDPYTLMRMVRVNILNSIAVLKMPACQNLKNYFCVSTDKAANPVNLMGASKRIMEKFLIKESSERSISMARFANVAFSDGSLLDGFSRRISNCQPLSAPIDVERYFVTFRESAILCLMSGFLGQNREIYFPKLSEEKHLIGFKEIAFRYLESIGYKPHICSSEEEARSSIKDCLTRRQWPCYFFQSDTTGEKSFEEFYTASEVVNFSKYHEIGLIYLDQKYNESVLNEFITTIHDLLKRGSWSKYDLTNTFYKVLPDLNYYDSGKYLDEKM